MQTFAQYTQVRKGDGSSYVTGVDLGTKNSAYTDTSSAVTYLDSTMSSKITKNRWNVWTSKNQSGKSVDVTFHDDVRFAEYASHDETGALLDPADYKNVVLGSMSALDEAQVQAKRAELLAALGFGSAAGQWVVPDGAWPFAYDPNYSTGTDVQPTQPGGNASPNAGFGGQGRHHAGNRLGHHCGGCSRRAAARCWLGAGSSAPQSPAVIESVAANRTW